MLDIAQLRLLSNVSSFFTLLPVLFLIINIKTTGLIPIVLKVQFILAGIAEMLGYYMVNKGINNIMVINLYTIAEFSLYNLFYLNYFKTFKNEVIFKLLFFPFFLTMLLDYIFYGVDKMGVISGTFESITFITTSLYLFYHIINRINVQNLISSYLFWINAGILIYFSGSLLIIVFDNYIISYYPKSHPVIWSTVHSFSNIVYNIFLSIGIWKTRKA